MRVLVDATPLVHGERAVRRNSRNLLMHLVERSGEVEYVLFYNDWRNNSTFHIHLPEAGPHSEYVFRLPGRFIEWSWQKFSLPAIEHFVGNFDLVYGTDLFFPPSRRAVTMTTLRGIAQVVVPDLLMASHASSLNRALNYALKHSDYFLAVSEHTKREIVEILKIDPDRVRVSAHGVDPQMRKIKDHYLVKKTIETRFGLDRPYVLYVGAISHIKNILRIIDAYSMLRSSVPDIPMVLAGPFENAYSEAVSLVDKLGLARQVKFLGSVSPDTDDLVYLYNGAKLLLYPTLHEGWTAPPLEAMACGVPVIASNCSSIPETCGGAARLVDPLSVEAISKEAVSLLKDDDLRASMIERGFRRVEECQWSRSAQRLEAIFKELVALGRHK